MTSTQANGNRVYSRNDYDETYKLIITNILAKVGIRMTRKDSKYARLGWNVFFCFGFGNMVVTLFLDLVTFQDVVRSGVGEDGYIVFMMLPCMGYMALAMLKTYKMVYKRDVFENLISELREMWPEGLVTEEEHTIISRALNELNIIVKGYYWCNLGLGVSFMAPSFVVAIRRIFGADIPPSLPYFYWLPYDQSQPVAYEFTLVMNTYHTLLTLWYMLAGDLLFCVFLSHITTQFDLMSVRITRLFQVPVDQQLIPEYPLGQQIKDFPENGHLPRLSNNEINSKQENELQKIIVRHNALIRLSGDVEDLFSFAIFINFFNSSIIICFCGFCCVMIEKWNSLMYKTFLATSLSQTWLLCWHGQKLLESSERVADALYNSGWYTAANGIKKSILIMIHRSQKNVYVTTYGFSIICLASYTAIIKTAWSYFTLLLNTYNP
uniref:Odorant receptor n=1 Tax=Ostrinia furnacalis TaxID=93504 RepID=A0A0E4B5A7_OSTFU|nr:putative olfactory receptor 34 [Ostrinia furnacalis]